MNKTYNKINMEVENVDLKNNKKKSNVKTIFSSNIKNKKQSPKPIK